MGRNDLSCNWALLAPPLFYCLFIIYALHVHPIPLRKENTLRAIFIPELLSPPNTVRFTVSELPRT